MMYNRHNNPATFDILDQSLFTTAGVAMGPNITMRNTTINNSRVLPRGQGVRSAVVMNNAKNDTASQFPLNPVNGQSSNVLAQSLKFQPKQFANNIKMSMGEFSRPNEKLQSKNFSNGYQSRSYISNQGLNILAGGAISFPQPNQNKRTFDPATFLSNQIERLRQMGQVV